MKDSRLEKCNSCQTEHIVSPPELRVAFFADISLAACLFCKSGHIDVMAVEIDLYAALCRACGAHGPVRVLGPKQYVDCVKAQAAHDWNQAASNMVLNYLSAKTEYTEGPAAASPVEGQARHTEPGEAVSTEAPGTLKTPSEGASVEQSTDKAGGEPRAEDRKPDNGGEAVTHSTTTPGPSTDPDATCTRQPDNPQGQESEAPDGGGAGIKADQRQVVTRVRDFLALRQMSAEQAGQKKLLGTTAPTLYKMLSGKPVSEATLINITNALDAHDRKAMPRPKAPPPPAVVATEVIDGVPVIAIGNNFAEPTSVNRCPAPTAPPRHARTP